MSAPLWKVIPPLTSLSVPSTLIPQSKKRPALTMGSVISRKTTVTMKFLEHLAVVSV